MKIITICISLLFELKIKSKIDKLGSKIKKKSFKLITYLLLILASEAEVGADPSILCLILGESALDDPDDMEAMGLLYSIECISELNTVSLRTLQPVCC